MSSASLLIELHTEELPPKALPALADAFAAGIERGLRAKNFLSPASAVTSYGSPRRLAVHVTQVVDAAPDRPFRQRLLPVAVGLDKLGNATGALLKKLTSLGATIDPATLKRESDGKQDVLVYEGVHGGVSLAMGLQAILDEAIAQLRATAEMEPSFLPAHSDLGRALAQRGDYDEAIQEFQTATRVAGGHPKASAGLAHVLALAGRHDEARPILADLESRAATGLVSLNGIAVVHIALGELEAAMTWIERAFQERDRALVWAKVHPRLDPLRPDPRFQAVLARMGLAG